jgi:hypothetical protein
MAMTPRIRKLALIAHITFSVGWLGAVAGFLALAVAALTSNNVQLVPAAYLAMDVISWCVILPCSIGAVVTGVIQSLGTQWGLFTHYWVTVKFLLTIAATLLLILHMNPISYAAQLAANIPPQNEELRTVGKQLLFDAVAALVLLLTIITISVYKPWGKIQYARKQQAAVKPVSTPASNGSRWGRYAIIAFFAFVLVFIIMHLMGGGLGHH